MQRLRLTKKEKEGVLTVIGNGIWREDLLEALNYEGGYNYEDKYTLEELNRILVWIDKKLGMEE